MKYFFFAALLFFSSINFVHAGTWSAPQDDPAYSTGIMCYPFEITNGGQVPTGSACSPDGSIYRFAPLNMGSFCGGAPGEPEPYKRYADVMRQICNPSANNPPTANAGIDRTITQPASSVSPSGAFASDADGSVVSTVWSFVSGPGSTPTITNGSTLTPTFSSLNIAGAYTFRLRVTDNGGLFTDDTMIVTVNVANPQCSDGIDNDGDGRVDSDDWGCHSDNNAMNALSYVPTDNDESNPYCNVPGWGPEVLVFDGWAGDGPGWCNGTAFGACPSNLGGGPTSLSAKGSPNACCRGFDNLGWVRQCLGSPTTPVNAACGSSHGTTISSEPSSGSAACQIGTYSNTPADTSTNWNWTCTGVNGGANASCTASKPATNSCAPTLSGSDITCPSCPQPGDEVYWSIPGTNIGVCPGNTYPATLQEGTKCTYGSTFEPDYRGSCSCTLYEYAAAPSSCTMPVNGACGPGAGSTTWAEPSGASACSAGSYTNSPADTGTQWRWTCSGSNGGSNASCSAWKDTVTGPSTPAPACAYGESASTMTYSRAVDGTNSYDDNLWGIWSPTCAADVWDSPFMNDAADFARANSVPEADVQAMQFSYLTYNFDDWFPQGGGPEQINSGTGSLSSMTWGLYQENGSAADLTPCYAAITVNICNPPPNYTLTVAVSPAGGGTISAPGITCGADCTESFTVNTLVTITASPASGYVFSSWSGACSTQTTSSCTLTMDSNKNATANFVLAPVFDYSLGPNTQISTTQGVPVNKNVTKTLVSGTAQSIGLSVISALPSGVSMGGISNQSCSLTCSSNITFLVSPTAAVGTHSITVEGSPLNRQLTFNLRVDPSPAVSVTCDGNPDPALLGEAVTWSANASGGTPPYVSYTWEGTDIPTSPAPTGSTYVKSYNTIGLKNANVTVEDSVGVTGECTPSPAEVRINFDPSFEEF